MKTDLLERCRYGLSAALLVVALIAGGGGGAIVNLAIELLGLLLLALVLASPLPGSAAGRWLPYTALSLIVAIPLLQSVPLPAAIWQSLPERGLAASAMRDAGFGGSRHALSLFPDDTWRSALCLLPAAGMFMSALRAGATERRWLIALALLCVIASMVLGVLQVGGGTSFYLHETQHYGNAVGFLRNRNHQATFLLIGVALVPALAASDRSGLAPKRLDGPAIPVLVAAASAIVLALAVTTTISRAGLLLAPPVLIAAMLLLYGRGRRTSLVLAIALAAVALAGGLLVTTNTVTRDLALRFVHADQDGRAAFWHDTWFAARQYWPTGSGVGTFVPVYASVETLDAVGPYYANHAHDDYLELLLETGAAGVAALVLFGAAVLRGLVLPMSAEETVMRRCASVAIALILIHSIVDYPLRTLSLITLFGLLLALIFPSSPRKQDLRPVSNIRI